MVSTAAAIFMWRIFDPVDTQLEMYLRLLSELGLKLIVALDTHVHADHITALGALQERTGCKTMVGVEGFRLG